LSQIGRNAPCPCGSGRKHKRCCLRRDADIALDAREAEHVWDRMQTWALDRFGDEIGGALKEQLDARGAGTDERPTLDEDLSLALCWLLIDRDVETGGTPAQLDSDLSELSVGERQVASRIAASGLGLHRVREAEPGAWIELEDLLDGRIVRVSSANVSREAVRWHLLLCRVMQGGPAPSLWGASGFYEPAEEPEVLDELRRIATENDLGAGTTGLRAALRVGAGELLCFVPPSRRAQPVPHTLEGDSIVVAEASWKLRDPDAAFDALCAVPGLALDDADADRRGRDVFLAGPAPRAARSPAAVACGSDLRGERSRHSEPRWRARSGRPHFARHIHAPWRAAGVLRPLGGMARAGDRAYRTPAGLLGRSPAQHGAVGGCHDDRHGDGWHAGARGITCRHEPRAKAHSQLANAARRQRLSDGRPGLQRSAHDGVAAPTHRRVVLWSSAQ
jgi:hypothetical protein